MVERHRVTFDVLYDRSNTTARQFGLVFTLPDDLRNVYLKSGADLQKFNGDDSWSLPMPGRFVIDRDSIIRNADVNPDYTQRPEPRLTVEALKCIAGRK